MDDERVAFGQRGEQAVERGGGFGGGEAGIFGSEPLTERVSVVAVVDGEWAVEGVAVAGPGRFGGQYFLTETDTGSRLRLASVCKVWVPFIGGALEDLILHHMKQLFDAEEAFTADWISKHH